MDKLNMPSFDEIPSFEIKHPDRPVTKQEQETASQLLTAIAELNTVVKPLKEKITEVEALRKLFLSRMNQWTDQDREFISTLNVEYERLEKQLLPLLQQLSAMNKAWKAAEKSGVN